MTFTFILLIASLILLIKGADFFVDASSSLALKFKIPPIIIGLTLVSIGTGAPELAVSLTALFQNSSTLSLSSIIGSNLFNTLVVLGICSFIYPITVKSNTVWKEIPFSILAVSTLIFLALSNQTIKFSVFDSPDKIIGSIGVYSGLILISMLAIFLYYIFGVALSTKMDKLKIETADEYINRPLSLIIIYFVFGIIGLIVGGQLTVKTALEISNQLNISQNIVGLLLISVGTSLPELFTSISATKRKEFDLVLGNVIGSNIINIFLVIGVSSMFKTLSFTIENLYNSMFLLVVTLVLLGSLFMFKKFEIGKKEGFVLLVLYLFYMVMISLA